ncbi:MAG TPA: hypothetical protein VOA64_12155 [Candidatus Dormibacteraeota bacterium]|nr:hypothetical protein [Candidatus Dormibacteraeota bacterium]
MEYLGPEIVQALRRNQAPRERKLAVCSSGAHLAPADRAEILVALAGDSDKMVAEHAGQALLSQPVDAFVEALKRDEVLPAVFVYASERLVGNPDVADALVNNKNCPSKCLVHHVPYLSVAGIQVLMDALDRVSESASLAAAILQSSAATAEHKRLLQELLGPEAAIDEAALAEAVAEAEPDLAKRQSLVQRLSKMPVSERVQFAIKGGSEARRTLIRDANKVVQRAVLQSPRLTEQEVEAFAGMSSLTEEVLRLIAGNRNFRKNYAVVRNLTNNPKTPLDVSLHLLPMLNAVDLKRLTTNKNIPETLRSTATKLQRQRLEFKK